MPAQVWQQQAAQHASWWSMSRCNPDRLSTACSKKPEYSTVLSSGGDEAIAHIERDPPYDLVLSDLMMAGLGGNGLIERMRQVQPDTPLVLVTPASDR